MSAWMLPAIVLIPLLSAAVVGLFRNTWSKAMVSWVACSTTALSFVFVLVLLVQFLQTGTPLTANLTTWGASSQLPTFGLLADSLSLWWMVIVTGVGLLIHIYSTGYMHDDPSFGRFMAELNYFVFAMGTLVLSDNFAGLLVGWANVGLASYLMIGFYIKKPSAMSAAIRAFVMNIIGEVGLVAGMAYIYMAYGSLKYAVVFDRVAKAPHVAYLIAMLLLLGAVAKSAQLPLHTWLPVAMEGPTPVSALLHAATMVTAGVYLVSRAWPIYQAAPGAAMTVAWIGGLGALFGSVVAAGQMDIKRVLAFSTMSQIGYMFLANGVGAYVAADFHFFTHAFFKACLFLGAGLIVHHYAGDQDMRHMGGLWKKDKYAAITFGVALLALVGFPLTAGFFSKDEIIAATMHASMPLFVLAVVAAGFTGFYSVRAFALVFLGEPYVAPAAIGKKKSHAAAEHGHGHDAHEHEHKSPASMTVVVGILAVMSILSGWLAPFGGHVEFLKMGTAFHGLELEAEPLNLMVSGIVVGTALVGMLISWFLYRPGAKMRAAVLNMNAKPTVLLKMFYFDELYEALFVVPTQALGRFIADAFDAKLIDGIVNGSGKVSAWIGSGLRRLQNGYIRRYALTIFVGVGLMLVWYIYYV